MRSASCLPLSLLLLAIAAFAPKALAQPMAKTVVVSVQAPQGESALETARQVEAQLTARRVSVVSMHDARDRFSARSRPPQTPSSSDLDALGREAKQAIQHVALGRTAQAQRSVREIMSLAERSLESLNRETATARQLLDACLALVRAAVHDGKRDDAIDQAMRCRRLVPDLSPSEASHPANVIGVLAEADDQLRRMKAGNLSVRTQPPRSCSVYLNGRHLGTTPFSLEGASAGEYRVQVECEDDQVGRVHIVQLGDQPVELVVDASFDRAVASDPRLQLMYSQADAQRDQLVGHALELGREVRADDVVLVSRSAQEAQLLRVQLRSQRLVAGAVISAPRAGELSRDALAGALDALAQGRFVGVSPGQLFEEPKVLSDAPSTTVGPEAVARQAVASQASDQGASAQPDPLQPAPPPVGDAVPEAKPLRKKWWFWTTLGIAVVGGVTAGLVLGLREDGKKGGEPTIDVGNSR